MSQLVHQPVEETERSVRILQAEVAQIARSGMVPASFRKGNEVDQAALMHLGLTAHALGVSNLSTALSHIYNVQGKMVISADLAVGVAEARGVIKWRTIESTATKCVVEGFRCDWPAEWRATPTRVEFTLDDAKRANLLGKDVWKQYPQSMLQARAKKMLAKLLAADVLTGLRDSNGHALDVVADAEDIPVVLSSEGAIDVQEVTAVDPWPFQWSESLRVAGFGPYHSVALISFASDGKVTRSVDLEELDRPLAETALANVLEGRWHIADGKVVEAAA